MDDKTFYISSLVQKELREDLTGAEREALSEWLNASEGNRSLYDNLKNEKWVRTELERFDGYDEGKNKARLLDMLKGPKAGSIRYLWRKMAVAASILFMVGLGAYFYFSLNTVKVNPVPVAKSRDVSAPQTNRATITLANGQRVYLDSAANGTLATQSNVTLIKTGDGQIIYDSKLTTHDSPLTYNTLSNPRGSKVIDMTLSDGSRVWLNAGSSVTYPIAFIGNERKVAINGEAYFEITHDASKPFYVSKGDLEVKVLGTHFNVNAYDDEESIKVTLLEGSVQVALRQAQGDKSNVRIKPGEQAVASLTTDHSPLTIDHSPFTIDHSPDLDQVMAWKNGQFVFRSAGIENIMRQLSRWYDIEVVYQGNKPAGHYGGMIGQNTNLSEVLKLLELSGVKFRIEGKKVIIMSH